MENEGIMGLPAGQDMQNPAPPQSPAYVSSAESYDAALQGLGIARNDPSQAEAVKQAVRESIKELSLSPTEVAAVLDVLEYMSQNPDQYPELRQRLIDSGMMDPDDLPETYDAAYLGMAIMVLNEYQASGVEGAQAPMQMGPEVENLGPMPMAEGGLADIAQYLASRGRNGDSMLAHITPAEARLLKQAGGAGTVNPETGIREFFLKKLFKGIKKAVKSLLKNPIVRVVATVALAAVIGPAAIGLGMSTAAATATASVLSSAAVSAAAGEKINAKSLLINAATSYFGAGGTIDGVNPVSSIAKFASKIPGVTEGGKLAQGIGAGVTSAAIGKAAGLSTDEALRMGLQQGAMTGVTYKPQAPVAADTAPPDVASGMGGDMSGARAPEAATAPATQQVGAAPTGAIGTAAELPNAPAMRYDPFTGKYTPSATAQAATAPMADVAAMPAGGTTAPGFAAPTAMGRIGQFLQDPSLETAKNAFLVNPNATTTLGRYVPAGLTLAGIGAATGGFESQPVEENPLYNRSYTGADFIRDNPQMFSGNLGRIEGMPPSYNPVVPTPSYTKGASNIPLAPVPLPRSATVPAPAMVAPPRGIEAIYGYGMPELSPPVAPPVYMAEGGAVGGNTVDSWTQEFLRNNPGLSEEKARAAAMQRVGAVNAARAPQPSASTGMKDNSAESWFQEFSRNNPTADPARLRAAAMERAGRFTGQAATPTPAPVTSPVTNPYTPPAYTPPTYTPPVYTPPASTGMPSAYEEMLKRFTAFNPFGAGQPSVTYAPGTGYTLSPLGMPQIGMPQFFNEGGSPQPTHFPRKNGPINGPGTGTSDSIPAMLSDGEFVFTAKAVRNAGGGSRRKGAKRMYALMKKLEGGAVKG